VPVIKEIYRFLLFTCCLICLSCGGSRAGDEDSLRIVPAGWERVAFPPPGIEIGEAASFEILNDPSQGQVLSVGQWQAGLWGARFQGKERLPLIRGTITGYYRAEDIDTNAAAVWVRYYKDKKYIHAETLSLPPASEWTSFSLVSRRPPPGTDAAYLAVGLRRHTNGTVFFAGLEFSPDVPEIAFPADPGDPNRPEPPHGFEPSKYFRLAQRDGVWWFVTPEGNALYSVGTDGPWIEVSKAVSRGAPVAALLQRHGFNTLGGWTGVRGWSVANSALLADGKMPMLQMTAMETGTWWGEFDHVLDHRGEPQNRGHAFPDPFDPRFEEAYRRSVQEHVKPVKGKPWLIGWFADNELQHDDLHGYVYSPHCAVEFRRFLEKRYGTIDALNSAWGTDFFHFREITDRKPDVSASSESMQSDARDFAREIVKRYIEITLRVFREEDPGRLVFGNRFMFGDFDYIDLYAAYDGIAINLYPDNDEPGLSDDEIAVLNEAYAWTGKPIVIGEWSVPALDSGLYDAPDKLDWSFPQTVPTQSDRARQAACIALDFYNLPFIVGAHWFTWRDFDSEKRRANRGLLTADDKPYADLLEALKHVHEKMGPAVSYPRATP